MKDRHKKKKVRLRRWMGQLQRKGDGKVEVKRRQPYGCPHDVAPRDLAEHGEKVVPQQLVVVRCRTRWSHHPLR